MSLHIKGWIQNNGLSSKKKPIAHFERLKQLHEILDDMEFGENGGIEVEFWRVDKRDNSVISDWIYSDFSNVHQAAYTSSLAMKSSLQVSMCRSSGLDRGGTVFEQALPIFAVPVGETAGAKVLTHLTQNTNRSSWTPRRLLLKAGPLKA